MFAKEVVRIAGVRKALESSGFTRGVPRRPGVGSA